MYGENGGLIRAELSALLRQHRIQQRIGGDGIYTVPATTSAEERQWIGEQIRRYRQGVLVWCHQATVAAAPATASNLSRTPVNPFRAADTRHGALTALGRAVEQAVDASTATLATLDELAMPHDLPLVEHWRHAARAAALGEHDFDAGLGYGRLDAQQSQTLIADIAAVVQALVVLDQRYSNIPGWEKLHRPERLGWSALACALDARLDPPDYAIDMRGWRPPTKVVKGPGKPGLHGVLQAEHNLVIRMRSFPSAMNLRLVVDSQRLLSGQLASLVSKVEPALHDAWTVREGTYVDLQHELRNVGGRIGTGGLAASEGANAVSRLRAIRSDDGLDPRLLHGFTTLFTALDDRIADVLEEGIKRNCYFVRVQLLPVENPSGDLVAPSRERYLPLGEVEHTSIVRLARDRLRPIPTRDQAPAQAARSRAELHAAIVHQPDRRPAWPTLSM
jgi:hypothetical protein